MNQIVETVVQHASGSTTTTLVCTSRKPAEALILFRAAKEIRAGATVDEALALLERESK